MEKLSRLETGEEILESEGTDSKAGSVEGIDDWE